MMNREGNTVAGVDSNSAEKYQVPDAQLSSYSSYHVGHPSLHSTIGSSPASWDSHMTDKGSTENGIPPNYGYNNDQYNQQREFTLSRDVHVTLNASSASSTSSSLGTTSGSHECAGYTSYPASADSYGYGTTGYQGQQSYYYGYPQQTTNPSYTQQVGANQTPGASYQTHTSSFQGTVSYVGPSSYSSTYYNAGDYQTTGGGYRSSGYSDQSNLWNDGNYGSYPISYSNYTSSDSNGTHSHGSTTVAATPVQYQQQYKQWTDYYSQSSDVSCAPGTENLSATSTSSMECSIPGNAGGYPISTDQPPPPGTTSWGPDATSLGLPSLQVTATIGGNHDSLWKHTSPGFSNNHLNYMQSYVHKPPESNPLPYESFENHQNNGLPPPPPPLPLPPPPNHSQGPIQYSSVNQGPPQNFQPPLQSSVPIFETHRVSKLQIPTNPRIAPSLALGIPKTDKESSTTDAAPKPAYVSVSLPKSNIKASSYDASTDAMLKPGQFPASLRAYVERSLARCKDDSQKAGCQNIMKEIITKASADGTLYTKNWDIEPLFPLPDLYSPDKDNLQGFVLPKYKRSPGRRIKSRWEPLPEEKLVKKVASVNYDPLQDVRWDRPKERERKGLQANSGKAESEDNASGIKLFSALQSNFQSKISPRPVKKPRLSDGLKGPIENGDASSDSDREQGLTQYYAAAVNLGNSPEERKKRENRFKRFDKGREVKPFTLKGVGDGNSYSRRTRDLFLSKNTEEGPAVEDMDWDALTVKGTCQEIEKRYLRLTSTPDPATVRPEEVLEKALLMVQASQKNYLYKCDQLKSVRQDLTVQRIRNELTVKVYETHARLALEAGDLPEYNQCQSQLQSLYVEGIKGCHMEFSAYNLLGVILHSNNNRDLLSSMARLSAEARKDEAIKHALAVRAAVTSGNYILFFRLYKTAPKLHTCLMDLYVEKMRFEAVRCMSRSYRPTVPLAFIAQVLGFSNTASIEGNIEDTDGLEECEEWLRAHGANLITNNSGDTQLDTKATSSTLYMPEPEDAVPHGDANLAVNDFFARTS